MIFEAAWLNAGFWSLLVSFGLVAGAAFGVYGPLEHRGIARVMAIGAGLLIAAATLELVSHAVRHAGPIQTAIAFASGAAVYSLINGWLSARAAKHRKRCGVCVQQPTEGSVPGSGLAIAMGTLLDGIPEGAVLGLEAARIGSPSWTVLAAFVLGNFAKATSSAAGMWVAGRSNRYIFTLWIAVAAAITLVAAASAALSGSMPSGMESLCNAFAAGALIAMIVETMIPEAAHDTPPFNGLIAAIGFVVIVLLLSH